MGPNDQQDTTLQAPAWLRSGLENNPRLDALVDVVRPAASLVDPGHQLEGCVLHPTAPSSKSPRCTIHLACLVKQLAGAHSLRPRPRRHGSHGDLHADGKHWSSAMAEGLCRRSSTATGPLAPCSWLGSWTSPALPPSNVPWTARSMARAENFNWTSALSRSPSRRESAP